MRSGLLSFRGRGWSFLLPAPGSVAAVLLLTQGQKIFRKSNRIAARNL
jgi:hypothetical protein